MTGIVQYKHPIVTHFSEFIMPIITSHMQVFPTKFLRKSNYLTATNNREFACGT